MNDEVRRRLEMLTRVAGFGRTYTDLFPPTGRGSEMFAAIQSAITEIERQSMTQSSKTRAAQQQTTSKSAARSALFEEIQVINLAARAMALSVRGLEDKFRVPYNCSDQVLLATARAFAQDAGPLQDEFIKREMPATFIDDLNAMIADFSETINGRNQATGARVSARVAIDEVLEQAMTAMRELDSIVKIKFRSNRAVLAEWASARHIERRLQKLKTEAHEATPPPSTESETPESNT